jgi:hypothetical protein
MLVLKPGLELKLREDFLGTSWVDPLRQELLNAQVQVFETCLEDSEWRCAAQLPYGAMRPLVDSCDCDCDCECDCDPCGCM